MKRWLFRLVVLVSLLLSLTAAAAWAMSYMQAPDWHLLGMAHSADLARVGLNRRTDIVMVPVNRSNRARFGYWDALWARSQAGRLTLVAHRIDYEGHLRTLHGSPPSLIVELSGPARARAVAFGRMPDSRPRARQLGFAWDAETQQARDGGSAVSVGARMIMLPYWFIIVLGSSLSLAGLCMNRKSSRARTREAIPQPSRR